MPKITRIQERDCVSENLGQDDEIEETYWGTLCISNIFAVPGWDELKFSLYIIRPRPIISLKKPISLNERPILVYVLFFCGDYFPSSLYYGNSQRFISPCLS